MGYSGLQKESGTSDKSLTTLSCVKLGKENLMYCARVESLTVGEGLKEHRQLVAWASTARQWSSISFKESMRYLSYVPRSGRTMARHDSRVCGIWEGTTNRTGSKAGVGWQRKGIQIGRANKEWWKDSKKELTSFMKAATPIPRSVEELKLAEALFIKY